MAGFNGRWRFASHSNLEAFHTQIKTPEAHRETLRGLVKSLETNPDAYGEEFKVDLPGKTLFRTQYINGEKFREITFPIGVETDETDPDGRPYKGTLTFDGDKKFTVHQKGADFEADLIYELKGDTIELTLSSGSVTGKETYNRA